LLEKRLIVLVINKTFSHWFGLCVVNPWKLVINALQKKGRTELAMVFKNKSVDDHNAGWFWNNSSAEGGKLSIKELRTLIWLLNLTSHYRDLTMKGLRAQINFVQLIADDEYQSPYLYFMGMHGPFGNLFYDTLETLPYKHLHHSEKTIFVQPNGYDCGMCWGLFIYDTVNAFRNRAFMVKNTSLKTDAYHFLGRYLHSEGFLNSEINSTDEWDNSRIPLCHLWQLEVLLMI
jgi:hypothetical protein